MTRPDVHMELIEGLAAGRLSPPLTLLARSYAEANPAAGDALSRLDSAGAALLESAEPAELDDDALATALAMIDALEAGAGEAGSATAPDRLSAAGRAADMSAELIRLPDSLRDRIVESGADWRFAAPGVRRLVLDETGDAKAELLRIEPGHGSPSHTHTGREFTLVLTGSFFDGHNRYRAGEVCETGPETTHRPIADPGEVCYALAVTEGSLKFKGPLGAVQRLFGG
ncbi:cupin domain-containing protein [Hyphobacterium marinum]|uniref:Cupin domain-containing protein n=1 Tax=Hyphobacterium marinum TaxID=3116574 RepID=A0ABU7LUR2_9PROT|nr:cupin domain-containing protein [Hyphobacterium sp. Y6023]MEE2565301.1 cupin domain-containing protein [Hyphobacterium sp. Y6023]